MNIWIIIAIVYIVLGILGYLFIIRKWETPTQFEKIWYSVFWIALIPLWMLHKAYNHFKKKIKE